MLRPTPGIPAYFFHDVTGDGKADFIRVYRQADAVWVEVWVNDDGENLRLKVQSNFQNDEISKASPARVFFADVTGNGVDDVVLCGDGRCYYFDLQGAGPDDDTWPGLLNRITYDTGASVEFVYMSLARLDPQIPG